MSALEAFGVLLTNTVAGDKLTSSKVDRVWDAANVQFHRSKDVTTIIVKVHRKAARRTRLSSLYLFEAICRYAYNIVRKKGSGFAYEDAVPPKDSRAQKGTREALVDGARSFLDYASDIVREMLTLTMESVQEDQKSKVFKVLDIWRKAQTFDERLLQGIREDLQLDQAAESNNRNGKDMATASSREGAIPDARSKGDAGDTNNSLPSPYGVLARQDDQAETASSSGGAPTISTHLLALLGGSRATAATAPAATKLSDGHNESRQPQSQSQAQLVEARSPAHDGAVNRQALPQAHVPSADPSNTAQPSRHVADQQHTAQSTTLSVAADDKSGTGFSFVPNPMIGDLSHFDMSVFDPTNAAHWVQYAQHWHNTYQYIPSNQELLWALMSAMQAQMYAASGYDQSSWQQ